MTDNVQTKIDFYKQKIAAVERERDQWKEAYDWFEQTLAERDAAEEAADNMASLILGEPVDWTFHDEAWQRAIEKLT